MKHPMLALACSFALGIALARGRLALTPGEAIPVALGLTGACLLAGCWMFRLERLRAAVGLAFLGFVFAGAAAGHLFELRFPPDHVSHLAEWGINPRAALRIAGELVTDPLHTPSGLEFDVALMHLAAGGVSRAASGKIRVWLEPADDPGGAGEAAPPKLRSGDAIRAEIRLHQPRVYRNPGSFDFRARAESIDDLYWTGTLRHAPLVQAPAGRRAARPSLLLEAARHRLLEGIDRLYPPWTRQGSDGAVLKAILLGDRSSLDSDTVENFRKSGLYHLLVIAGLHVGLLAMLVGALLGLFRLRRMTRSIVLLGFLVAYASLVEQRAPTLRATIMIVAFLVAGWLDRQHAALNAVGLAAFILLASRPAWLFESGFQLSFAAALLIAGLAVPILERSTEPYRRALYQLPVEDRDVLLAPRVAQFRLDLRSMVAVARGRVKLLDRHPALAAHAVTLPVRAALWTVNILLFSAVLQLGLLLPMAETFHRVTLAGIGLNALAIPVMTILLAVAFPTMILGALVPTLAAGPARLLAVIVEALFRLTRLPHLPAWLSYRVPSPPAWVALGFAVSIVVAAVALGRWRRVALVAIGAFALFAALVALHPFAPRLPTGVLELTALDCGGGDATLIVLSDRTTVLVGTGGGQGPWRGAGGGFRARPWDPGENIVSPYLWSRGLKKIDVLVVPETRGSQLAGADSVLANFQVDELWHPPAFDAFSASDPGWAAILEHADAHGTRVREMAAGRVVTRRGASLGILWPPRSASSPDPLTRRERSAGGDSLVLRITSGGHAVLLPGRITAPVEKRLADSGVPLESTLLKVGHQGAKSALIPEWTNRVRPHLAVIAVEGGNARNLPNPQTLDQLREAGATVLRTDLDGAVTVTLTPSGLQVVRASGTVATGGRGASSVRAF